MIEGMAGMALAASAGHFAIDPGTGERLLAPLSEMQEAVQSALKKAGMLDRPTRLGELDEARAVSDLNREVAAGDHQSLLHVLGLFKTSLDHVCEAVRQGMANYEQVDAEMRQAYERGLADQRRDHESGPSQQRRGEGTVLV